MKLSDYLKEQHMSTTRGTDDTYPELFMDWWGELELEDLDKLAEGWLGEKETISELKVSKEDFDNYVDDVLGRMLPDEPYTRVKYNVRYAEWQSHYHLVSGFVHEKFKDLRWYNEYLHGVRDLIAETTLVSIFIAKVVKEREHKVSGNYEMPGEKETRENLSKFTIRKD